MAAKIGHKKIGHKLSSEQPADAIVRGEHAAAQSAGCAEYADAGHDEIHVNQTGPDQRGFFEFYADAAPPAFRSAAAPGFGDLAAADAGRMS